MRRSVVVAMLALGIGLLSAVSATAQIVPWLTVSPPFARPGDSVVINVTGPPGHEFAVAYSFSSAGAGSGILLGGDFQVLASGVIPGTGSAPVPVQIPGGVEADFFLQAGVWPPGGAMTLTNGVWFFITPDRGNGISVPQFVLAQSLYCPNGIQNVLTGLQFYVIVAGVKPIREAFLQGPAGFMGSPTPLTVRMLGSVIKGPFMNPSGYPYSFGYEYSERLTPAPNFGYFPNGWYTINVSFADGGTASTSVELAGSFPTPASFTSPTCDQANVGRNPTIQLVGVGSGQYEMGVGVFLDQDPEELWRYVGTANSVTLPADLLWPDKRHHVHVDIYGPRTPTGGRKGSDSELNFYTGPAPVGP